MVNKMVKGDITDYFGLSGYTADQLKKMGYIVWSAIQPKGSFLAEGDTFTYLNLINNGLNAYKNDTYGGWGGQNRAVRLTEESAVYGIDEVCRSA